MKYLLLNGTSTRNIDKYIKDALILNFSLNPTDIPFNSSIGIKKYILEDSIVEFLDKLRSSVGVLLETLNNKHSIRLSLQEVYLENNVAKIKIKLDNKTSSVYNLPTTPRINN